MKKIILMYIILFLIIRCNVYIFNNFAYGESKVEAPGIPSLKIRDSSCCHFVKLQVGMTGKVDEVIIERKAQIDKDFEEVYKLKSEEPKEFMGSEYYDEDVMSEGNFIYRVYSKIQGVSSPKSKEYEFKMPPPDEWYYPAQSVKIVKYSEMPRVNPEPYQVGYFAEKVITARILPEYIAGTNIVYAKYSEKESPYANYGIYRIDPNDKIRKYDVLWEDEMEESLDIGWEHTGRFFMCDVTGDGIDELGLILISGNLNIQRVYFFKIKGSFECIFKNKFNVNDWADEGDFIYKIKTPKIIVKGRRKDPNKKPYTKPGPYMEYWKVYKYNPKIERFMLLKAKERYWKESVYVKNWEERKNLLSAW